MSIFYKVWCTALVCISTSTAILAQVDSVKQENAANINARFDTTMPAKIAVFLPLYLNETFQGASYELAKETLPRNVLPGLEFYNGVLMAVDSLAKEGVNLNINVYDTRQPAGNLNAIFNHPDFNQTGLIIASLTTPEEVNLFAAQALKKNIPLISATYPNVAGVRENPFFVVLNSSLQTHLSGIFNHLQTNYKSTEIIAFKKAGAVEDYIKSTFMQLNSGSTTGPLKLKWVELNERFTANDVKKHLDSTRNNIVFVASPLERFGLNIVKTLNPFENYRTTAIGMPTWDGLKELNGKDYSNVEIVYSTPFNYSRSDQFETVLAKKYRSKYYSRPSDMVFRGFETTYHFGKLLLQFRSNLINNLSSDQYKMFNNFDVVPVKVRSNTAVPDYLENKKLYFLRKQGGYLKGVL